LLDRRATLTKPKGSGKGEGILEAV